MKITPNNIRDVNNLILNYDESGCHFLASEMRSLYSLYDNDDYIVAFPSITKDYNNNPKMSINLTHRDKHSNFYGNRSISGFTAKSNMLSHYHLDESLDNNPNPSINENMSISSKIFRNDEKNWFIKETRIQIYNTKAESHVQYNPQCSYILSVQEVFDDQGNKIFEHSLQRKNNPEKYTKYDEDFDHVIETISCIENSETGESRATVYINNSDLDEPELLTRTIGESEDKTLPKLKIINLDKNQPITNFSNILNNYISFSEACDDSDLIQTMNDYAKSIQEISRQTNLQFTKEATENILKK